MAHSHKQERLHPHSSSSTQIGLWQVSNVGRVFGSRSQQGHSAQELLRRGLCCPDLVGEGERTEMVQQAVAAEDFPQRSSWRQPHVGDEPKFIAPREAGKDPGYTGHEPGGVDVEVYPLHGSTQGSELIRR